MSAAAPKPEAQGAQNEGAKVMAGIHARQPRQLTSQVMTSARFSQPVQGEGGSSNLLALVERAHRPAKERTSDTAARLAPGCRRARFSGALHPGRNRKPGRRLGPLWKRWPKACAAAGFHRTIVSCRLCETHILVSDLRAFARLLGGCREAGSGICDRPRPTGVTRPQPLGRGLTLSLRRGLRR